MGNFSFVYLYIFIVYMWIFVVLYTNIIFFGWQWMRKCIPFIRNLYLEKCRVGNADSKEPSLGNVSENTSTQLNAHTISYLHI